MAPVDSERPVSAGVDDPHGAPRRLTRFLVLEQKPLTWLPVSEAAFLLWVLVALIVGWLVVGLILGLV